MMIVMEFAAGGTLFDLIEAKAADQVMHFIHQFECISIHGKILSISYIGRIKFKPWRDFVLFIVHNHAEKKLSQLKYWY